ncbi:hypothetical protein MKW94_000467, partial [Papaver nudicaule]|nr:hypothetical protein [Papaver nudicaule]
HPNGSCASKQSRSKKNSGKAKRTLTAKKSKKVQSTGSELSGLLSACQATDELCKSYSVSNSISAENWMAVLEGVPDLDEDLRLDAVNLLGRNPLSAQIFVLMSPDIRKKWLIAKLRGN